MKLVIIGGVALDYLSKVKDVDAGCTQITDYSENIGGMAYNTAMCTSQLGIDTRLISAVGKDFQLLKNMENLHLDFHITDGKTTRSFLFYDDERERIYFYPGSYHNIDVNKAKDAIVRSDWVHFAGVAPCFSELIEFADSEGKITSCNPGYDIFHYDPADELLSILVDKSDYLILSSDEAKHLSKPVDSIVNGAVIITMGKNGSIVVDKKKRETIKAYATDSKSPFGAGDAYTGTFIVSMMHENGLVKSAKLASAASSFAVEERKSTPELDWDKIKKRAKKL
jgi:ribokinase